MPTRWSNVLEPGDSTAPLVVPAETRNVYTNGPITALPPDWNPTLAPMTVIPEALCVQQVRNYDQYKQSMSNCNLYASMSIISSLLHHQVDFELFHFGDDVTGDDSPVHADMCNPDVATALHNAVPCLDAEGMDFEDMIIALCNTFNRVQILEQWMEVHSKRVQNLTPTELRSLFMAFTTPDSQLSVAELTRRYRRDISCIHITEVATVCIEICRRDVVDVLCGLNIIDKENRNLVQQSVGNFEFISLEQYF